MPNATASLKSLPRNLKRFLPQLVLVAKVARKADPPGPQPSHLRSAAKSLKRPLKPAGNHKPNRVLTSRIKLVKYQQHQRRVRICQINTEGGLSTMEPVQCIRQHEATDLVRHCLENGKITPGKHFRDKLVIEGMTFVEAWGVLRTGQIYDPAEQNMKTGEWVYRMQGYTPGGKWVVIALCFRSLDETFLITMFTVKTRKKR